MGKACAMASALPQFSLPSHAATGVLMCNRISRPRLHTSCHAAALVKGLCNSINPSTFLSFLPCCCYGERPVQWHQPVHLSLFLAMLLLW
jgi:hypothetical protein